jgi:hypothetical protein
MKDILGYTARTSARMDYHGRGLSDRTVEALIAHGIMLPENLLLMTEDELKAIPGIGKASMSQIKAYRDRFTPKPLGVGDIEKIKGPQAIEKIKIDDMAKVEKIMRGVLKAVKIKRV